MLRKPSVCWSMVCGTEAITIGFNPEPVAYGAQMAKYAAMCTTGMEPSLLWHVKCIQEHSKDWPVDTQSSATSGAGHRALGQSLSHGQTPYHGHCLSTDQKHCSMCNYTQNGILAGGRYTSGLEWTAENVLTPRSMSFMYIDSVFKWLQILQKLQLDLCSLYYRIYPDSVNIHVNVLAPRYLMSSTDSFQHV